MNVRRLIQEAAAYDGETEILVATEEEGNSFRPLYEVSMYFVRTDELDSGELDLQLYDVPDCDHAADEVCTDFQPRIVLWP